MKSTPAKIAGILAIVAGVLFVVAGGVTWGIVTSQLKAENITVPEDSAMLPGDRVDGPLSAYAQANIINEHALAATEGRTYAELGAAMNEVEEGSEEHQALQAQRGTIMNASFLRASLFTSVVSYGVAALVMGLGVLFVLVGWALTSLVRPASVPVATSTGSDRSEPARV
ncbi:aromatic ring-opening dioxygenase LigA [Georgenia subflava]|uniref:Aromatic ring-opening dioxygenase LigA n=1 Tax=Georgenia subflava TaxID=1622177 RepID=A0A6N7EU32_9MICO|nr:aromatic ring-opening dioxygenase LigA [Georgenia subflava]MPV38654.1 aromatic ring-opening dioxygenase LigA [Georgenia subflava]